MDLKRNYPLKKLNTFDINVDADYYLEVALENDLLRATDVIAELDQPYLVLGGGSNVLFRENYKGLIIRIGIAGIEQVYEDSERIELKVGAGVVWDDLVAYCVSKNLGGLENLSLIPGSVGASPVQNIGAYGVEMKDHFYELEYFSFEKKN